VQAQVNANANRAANVQKVGGRRQKTHRKKRSIRRNRTNRN
jgi:hypothetical protein